MTEELKGVLQHPTLQQMLRYSFVGSKQTVKSKIKAFLEETQVNELITVSSAYALEDRVKSVKLFGEIMTELNEEK